jgi:hypothetical protein
MLICDAAISGGAAALTSALVAARESLDQGSSGVAPLNAVTHCLWPEQAFDERRPSLRFTGVGAVIHGGSGIFWGLLYEMLRGRSHSAARIATAAAATAATAYVVDYHVVPKRLTPGFEAHISKRSFPKIYVALGVGLAIASLARR